MGEAAYRIGPIGRAIDAGGCVRKATVGDMGEQTWWQGFHDAVLVRFSYEWKSAVVVFETKTARGPRQIHCEGVELLAAPQQKPWGPSVFIDGIAAQHGEAGVLTGLRIEMQTGDHIVVRAARCAIVDGPS